jgi:G:T-mismatch repair DNA endonuclease (very short patch repair protein)
MKIRKVKIKGKIRKLIKENGIWVYLYHFCKHCRKRILWNKWHERNGIPEYIKNHHNPFEKGEGNPNYKGKLKRGIPLPEKQKEKISKSLTGKHQTIKTRKKRSNAIKKHHQDHPETRELQRKATKKRYQDHPEIKEKQSNFMKEFCQKHPEHMINASKGLKFVSEPELIVREYTSKELVRLNIKYHINLHEIKGTPDMTIETGDGHPIALFEDGCYIHGCLKCFPFNEGSHEEWKFQSKARHYNKIINEELKEQGYKIVRIWEHDVYNGNFKKIIKKIISKIKSVKIIDR